MTTLLPRFSVAPLLTAIALLFSGPPLQAQLELFGRKEPKPVAVFPLKDWGTSAAFSPDGKQIAIGTYGKVLIIDVAAKKVVRELAVKSGYVRGVAWLPDNTTLLTGCFQAVEFWNTADGKKAQTLKVKGYANDVKVSPDGAMVAAATETGDVRLWSTADGAERTPLSSGKEPLLAIAFSADGRLIAGVGGDDTRLSRPGVAKVWNVSDGSEAKALDVVPEKCANDVSFSPDGSALYVADMNDRVTVFDVATGIARGFFGKHARPVNSVVPFRDGQRIVSGGGGRFQDGNVVKFWTPADGKELATLEHHAGKVSRVALSPDETQLLTVSFDKTAALWDVADVCKPGPAAPAKSEQPRLDSARSNGGRWKLPLGPQFAADFKFPDEGNFKRIGIIGLDTSHATAFTKEFNPLRPADKKNPEQHPGFAEQPPHLKGFRITAAYPKGSPDIESSVSRVPGYTEIVKKHNVKIVDSIDDLLKEVDYVLLETNDGRPHLEQVLPVLAAGKPVFVDKPIAASLADAVAIYEAARHYKTPVFSSSSLRFAPGTAAARNGKLGTVLTAEATSPCSMEPSHPDFYWYGIHGVETLFTIMGPGCESVKRVEKELAVGTWKGGRTGTFRGTKPKEPSYRVTLTFDVTKPVAGPVQETPAAGKTSSSLYSPLLVEIIKFFQTGQPPVTENETLEIYAFMSAADESKNQGGAAVKLEDVLVKARDQAKEVLAGKLK